ncbi:MAG: RES domain-containing protein, partial [Cyanobacteria bacterium J06649_11]
MKISRMYCCHNCFGDLGLKKEIIPLRSENVGNCDYCDSEGVDLIEPRLLAEYFELLISIYESHNQGESLVSLLKKDWGLFDHPVMDDAHTKELLADILDDGEIVRKKFVPSYVEQEDNINIWEEFKMELMHQNRFFPKTPLDKFRLEELLSRLIADEDELPQKWYRTRLHQGDTAFELVDMGAPPKRKASHGRANPSGIPYLYLGSTHKTAISEVRPHPGESASVAEFEIANSLKIV